MFSDSPCELGQVVTTVAKTIISSGTLTLGQEWLTSIYHSAGTFHSAEKFIAEELSAASTEGLDEAYCLAVTQPYPRRQ